MHNIPHTEESKQKISKSHKGIPNLYRRRKMIEKDGVTLYICRICKEFKPYEDFYKDKRTILGIKTECKKCHNKESVRLRNKDNAREKNKEYARRARLLNPEKFKEKERKRVRKKDNKYIARRELNNAVKRGEVIKPICCEDCGAETKLSAHHNDYSKPLDVI